MAAGQHRRRPAFVWCIFYGSGIFASLVLYGVLQERIMAVPYDGVMYEDAVGLVYLNRVVAIVCSMFANTLSGGSFHPQAPLWKYMVISISNVCGSVCQYNALKHVSFPVQTLGKSMRELPVMVWTKALGEATYGCTEWTIAATMATGVCVFLMTGPIGVQTGGEAETQTTVGLVLLAMFVVSDAFTSSFQEKLFKDHGTSLFNQMLYINLGSAILTGTVLVGSGRFTKVLYFAAEHPRFARDALFLSFAAVLAQWFIYALVKDFGALVLACTLNMRQMTSIVLSYQMYSHSATRMQVSGLVLVFCSLFCKSGVQHLMFGEARDERLPLLNNVDTDESDYSPKITADRSPKILANTLPKAP